MLNLDGSHEQFHLCGLLTNQVQMWLFVARMISQSCSLGCWCHWRGCKVGLCLCPPAARVSLPCGNTQTLMLLLLPNQSFPQEVPEFRGVVGNCVDNGISHISGASLLHLLCRARWCGKWAEEDLSNKCLMLLSLCNWGLVLLNLSDEVRKHSQFTEMPKAQTLLSKGIPWRREVLLWSSPTLLLPGDFERFSYNKFRIVGFRIIAVAWLHLLHPGYTQDGGTGSLHCCRCFFSVLPTWSCSETLPRHTTWTNPVPTKSPRDWPLSSAGVGYHRWCDISWPFGLFAITAWVVKKIEKIKRQQHRMSHHACFIDTDAELVLECICFCNTSQIPFPCPCHFSADVSF